MKIPKLNRLRSTAAAVLCSVLMFALAVMPPFADALSVKASAVSGLSARQITSQMTIGWNLGNSLDSTLSSYDPSTSPKKFAQAWGNPEPTQELLKTVKNAGFNTVRIPVTWYQHIFYNSQTQKYEINPDWLDYVKKTVDHAYDLNMFVILNIHHEDWVNVPVFNSTTLAKASEKLEDIWSQLAQTFKDYDQRLIFEGMNEPRQTGNSSVSEWGIGSGDNGYTWSYINNLNKLFITTIRQNGSSCNKERLLMIPAYCATSDTAALNALNIPSNSGNIAISVHAYSPYFFAMDTSGYANHTFPGSSGYGENYESSLTNLFKNLKSVSDSKGVPIIIGEFSSSDFNNTSSRVNWAKSYLSKAKAAGIPCVLWDNNVSYNGSGEAHGYIYRATNTIYPNSSDVLKAMMDTVGVSGYVLPEYQEYEAPVFSWDKISVGSDWVRIFYSQSGKDLTSWSNFTLSGWKDYISKDYKLAVVYDAESEPNIIFQGGWYQVAAHDTEDFIVYFTYDDMMNVLNGSGASLDSMYNLFVGATNSSAKIYAVYAVPVNGSGHTHSYTSKVTKAASCTGKGERTYTCACGEKYTEAIPALGHSCKTTVTAPTYAAQGYTLHKCTRCSYSYKTNYTGKKTVPTVSVKSAYTSVTDAVRVNWTKVKGASGYRIYRYNTSTKKWVNIKTIENGAAETYRDAGLKSGTQYKYKVKAYVRYNGTVYWGSASREILTATKPGKVTIGKINISTTSVRLFWNKVSCTGYKVQQSSDGGKTWKTVKLVKGSEELKIRGLKRNTSYKYRALAYKSNGGGTNALGAWSGVKTVRTKK